MLAVAALGVVGLHAHVKTFVRALNPTIIRRMINGDVSSVRHLFTVAVASKRRYQRPVPKATSP
ncbi:hypothetical protein GGQ66_003779 [Rhizobium borbori]|uniref:Uncharacterized protein n=1 Tax=Allorhizobium borbori TaxID=485907 RepID=A0A7W6K4Y4_9HYPH|nr:hypothetical protein [Allorhizobium borbori]